MEPDLAASPWRTLSSRQVYANAWMRVREDAVLRPDGSPGIYGVVGIRSQALGAVPLFPDGTTVLVGQYRYTLSAWSWEIPEGGGALGEDPRAEAARELREETGLTARRWTDLGPVEPSNSITDQLGRVFLAEDLTEGEPTPDETEQLRLWRLPLVDAVAMALDGRISDALAVVGLCRANAAVRRRGACGSIG
jgi:8-oxo-dGTP pyrophosphatase MutT (NUDIX family)